MKILVNFFAPIIGIVLLIILSNCTGEYIKLRPSIIDKYGINETELKSIQYFSDYYNNIEFKANEIVKSDTGIVKGKLYKEKVIERNFIDIQNLTPGVLIDAVYDSTIIPIYLLIKFDKELEPYKFSNGIYSYFFNNDSIKFNGISYKLIKGDSTTLWIKKTELEKLIINRKKAQGLQINN